MKNILYVHFKPFLACVLKTIILEYIKLYNLNKIKIYII